MRKSEDREVSKIYAVKYAHNANRTRNGTCYTWMSMMFQCHWTILYG